MALPDPFPPEARVRVTLTGAYPFSAVSFDHVAGAVTAQGVILTGADANRVREQIPSRPVEPEDLCFDLVERPAGTGEAASEEDSGEAPALPAELGEHKGAGWYYVVAGGTRQYDEDGEPLLVGRGKETAQAQIDEMNR